MPDLFPAAAGPACVPNIGPRGRRMRLLFGVVAFAVGAGVLAALAWSGAPRAWRLLLLLPFTLAGTGYFQAREKT